MVASKMLTSWSLRALKLSASAIDRVGGPATSGIIFLIYHRVGGKSGLRVDLPEWLFHEQMARLSDTPGTTDIDSALSLLRDTPPPGPSPVVVTFDDGTCDFIDIVLPILDQHQTPATLYVATDFIESGREFPGGGRPVSWAGLADALSTGLVTIGSHTHHHLLLDRADPIVAAEDLDRSKELIGERLGIEPGHFAYPKALTPPHRIDVLVRARFRSAALAGTRPNPYGRTDPYRLSRSPIQVEDGLRYFTKKVTGGMAFEDRVRRLSNKARLTGRFH